jgi:hypothetical protein
MLRRFSTPILRSSITVCHRALSVAKGAGPAPPRPDNDEIERYLPVILESPKFEDVISKMDLFDSTTAMPIPRDALPDRRQAIKASMFSRGGYDNPVLKPLWDGIYELANLNRAEMEISETPDLYESLLALAEKFKDQIYLNNAHPWLPSPEINTRTRRPLTIFPRYTKEHPDKKSKENGFPEPQRLEILGEYKTRVFMKLQWNDILSNARAGPAENKTYRVGVFHGPSGSGKTSAMLAVAVKAFGAEIVVHCRGSVLESAIPEDKNVAGKDITNVAVHDALLKVLENIKPLRAAREICKRQSTATVAIVLDEMGPCNYLLRAVCAARTDIARSIVKMLRVQKVVLFCGGTGVDTVEGNSTKQSATATNPNDYYIVSDFGVEPTDWTQWLECQGPAGKLVQKWLEGNNTHLCRLANDLLTNCRSAKIFVNSLTTKLAASKAYDLVKEPWTIEQVMPNEILECILDTIDSFKALNGLSDIGHVPAAELIREAVALQMCAVKDDLTGSTHGLLTTYGILMDTWTGLDVKTRNDLAECIGLPRYRISRALVTMGRLGVGRLISRLNVNLWSSWEDDTGRFFATLGRSTMMMKKLVMSSSSAVALALTTDHPPVSAGPRGFQYVDNKNLRTVQTMKSVQIIPMIPKEWDFWRDRKSKAFITRNLAVQLQPKIEDAALDKLIDEIKPYAMDCDFVVLNNAPRAKYADVLCINNLNRELWLVQCKFSDVSNRNMKVMWEEELNKMGYEGNSDAARFTKKLSGKLSLPSQRYFLCLAHGEDCKPLQGLPKKYRNAPNVHVLEHPSFDFGVVAPMFSRGLTSWMETDSWAPKKDSGMKASKEEAQKVIEECCV